MVSRRERNFGAGIQQASGDDSAERSSPNDQRVHCLHLKLRGTDPLPSQQGVWSQLVSLTEEGPWAAGQ